MAIHLERSTALLLAGALSLGAACSDRQGNDTNQPQMSPLAIPDSQRASDTVKAAENASPPQAFARCTVCHNAAKGAPNKLGPNLWGIFGSKAGQQSFGYSNALKRSGLVFDESTLDKWLENPSALVPGTSMVFPGEKDPANRKEIIEYLKRQR